MKNEKQVFGIKSPKKECKDKKCPFHGTLNVKKKSFTGTVVSSKMHGTAVVEWERRIYVPKYERYSKRKTKIKVHNPECISAKEGDVVKMFSTRPLSKTIHAVIVENLGKEKNYILKKKTLKRVKLNQLKKKN